MRTDYVVIDTEAGNEGPATGARTVKIPVIAVTSSVVAAGRPGNRSRRLPQ
jgi:hypothetical protein